MHTSQCLRWVQGGALVQVWHAHMAAVDAATWQRLMRLNTRNSATGPGEGCQTVPPSRGLCHDYLHAKKGTGITSGACLDADAVGRAQCTNSIMTPAASVMNGVSC